MSFNNVFGGSTLQATDVGYRAVALSANLSLVWPQNSLTGTDYLAKITEVTPTGSGFSITLPPANQVSNGIDVLFTNPSAFAYSVLDNLGSTVVTVAAGQQVLVYVAANATVAGTWRSFLYGAANSALSAGPIQGLGVVAIGPTLNAGHLVSTISASTTIAASDRSALYIWAGGVGTLTLPTAASVGNTFFFEVRNQGSGILTIAPAVSEFIDSVANIALQPTESCFVHSAVGVNWYTVGRGRSTQFNFTQLNKTVTGGTVALTNTEASSVVQKYTGALTSNQIVVLPAVIQVYYISNQTTGAFTFTFQSPTPGLTVVVNPNQNAILFCDGTNVINSSTAAGNTSLSVVQGSAGTPSISIAGNPTTGIFQPITNTLAVTANGAEVARFTVTGINQTAIGASVASTGAFTTLSATGASTFATVSSTQFTGPLTGNVVGTATNVTGVVAIANGGTGSSTAPTALTALGAAALAGAAFAGAVSAPGFTGPLTGNVTGNVSGTSANVTGVVALANGGTNATTAAAALISLGAADTNFTTPRTSTVASTVLPAGTSAQRDASPLAGYLRYNTTTLKFEGYSSGAWGSIGGGSGATGGGQDNVYVENDHYQTTSYTLGQTGLTPATISIAAPGVVSQANTYVGGEEVFFITTGALPAGLTPNTTYFVATAGLTVAGFQVSATRGGASITTSGTQSGAHMSGKAKSAQMVGPLTIATGATLTIPTGQRLVIQ